MTIATGQFTIIDYNDALSLTGYIGSNQAKTQMFNPDAGSYTPDWSPATPLVLTPSLFILGTASDIIGNAAVTSVQWFDVTGGVENLITATATRVFSGAKNQILSIKANEQAGLAGKDYMCKIIYHDATTNLDLTYKMSISFSRVVNGGGIADAIAWCPNGNVFKNGAVATLLAQCDLWRGSTLDTSLVTYRWFKQDANVFAPTTVVSNAGNTTTKVYCNSVTGMVVGESVLIGANSAKTIASVDTTNKFITLGAALTGVPTAGDAVKHASYDSDAGAGWRFLPADVPSNITGVTTNTVTIYNAYVINYTTLMCCIRDMDPASNTYYNTTLTAFKDTVSFIDQSDTIQISITSTGGDVFKNGVGSTTLTAKVYQNGTEIDAAGTKYTYTWTIFDKDGNVTTFNGGASTKTGKSITVGDLDVAVKATFQVQIS